MDLPDILDMEDSEETGRKERIGEIKGRVVYFDCLTRLYTSPDWKKLTAALQIRYDWLTQEMISGRMTPETMLRCAGAAKELRNLLGGPQLAEVTLNQLRDELAQLESEGAIGPLV